MYRQPAAQHGSSRNASRKSRAALITALVALVIIAAGGIAYLAFVQMQADRAEQNAASAPEPSISVEVPSESTSTAVVVLPDNPVDFASLQAENYDICGWINVPNTQIDYPILRSSDDPSYYLDHDYTGESSGPGSIYMEPVNDPAFTDPNTVLYGHDGYGDTMFTTLHDFEDETFFEDNPRFTICIPQHVLTYEVVSAFMYDSRHILNSFNFNDVSTRLQYFSMVSNPVEPYRNAEHVHDVCRTRRFALSCDGGADR